MSMKQEVKEIMRLCYKALTDNEQLKTIESLKDSKQLILEQTQTHLKKLEEIGKNLKKVEFSTDWLRIHTCGLPLLTKLRVDFEDAELRKLCEQYVTDYKVTSTA